MPDLPDWNSIDRDTKDVIIGPLWAEGKSAAEIAKYFTNATRNSIIGVVHRIRSKKGTPAPGWTKAKKTRTPVSLVMAKPRPKPRADRNTISSKPLQAEPQERFDAIHNERDPLPGIEPIGIMDLPNRPGVRCRFMVRGQLYCGAPSSEHTYCETHRTIAYRPTEPIKIKVRKWA